MAANKNNSMFDSLGNQTLLRGHMEEVLAIENVISAAAIAASAAVYKLYGLLRRLRDILDFEDRSLN
jgi:hypothetical protein